MSEPLSDLAHRLKVAVADLSRLVERMNERQWRSISREEGWPVGTIVNHVGKGLLFHAGIVRRIANGREPRAVTMTDIDEINCTNSATEPPISREEARRQLERHGDRLSQVIEPLSPEQLDRPATLPLLDGQVFAIGALIENVVVGHVEAHSQSIRSTLAEVA